MCTTFGPIEASEDGSLRQRGEHTQEPFQRRPDGQEILRGADKVPVAEVAKKHGTSEQTLYVWRKYGHLEAADVCQLRGLQKENEWLKKLLAERDLAIEVMKEINAKKW
jgi:hypothetical protein